MKRLVLFLVLFAGLMAGGPTPARAGVAGGTQIYPIAEVDTKPTIVTKHRPQLPAGVSQAEAYVAVVVEIDGSVGETKLLKTSNADYGVRAAAAAKKFKFKPAVKAGLVVRCLTVLPFATHVRGKSK